MNNYLKDMKLFEDDIKYVRGLIPEMSSTNFDRNLCNLTISINYKKNDYSRPT